MPDPQRRSYSQPVTWHPLTMMPTIAALIDQSIEDTLENLATLNEACTRPGSLDNATVDRIDRLYAEQEEFVAIYAEQIERWRTARPSPKQRRDLDAMAERNEQLADLTDEVLALAKELREGTIDRIMGMSDLELGLMALMGRRPGGRD